MMLALKPDQPSVFLTRLMNDLDPALFDFIKTNVDSFIKWDLIRFFNKNRQIIDTAENIARYVGRKAAAIEPELAGLVASGIMVNQEFDGISTYSLTSDDTTWALVSKFVSACEVKEIRIKVVYHIIQGDAKSGSPKVVLNRL